MIWIGKGILPNDVDGYMRLIRLGSMSVFADVVD